MKRRFLLSAQIILSGLFVFSFLATILQFYGNSNPLARFDDSKSVYNHIEAYDPSLSRLNSIKKIEQYCDSIYAGRVSAGTGTPAEFEMTYTNIVSNVIRNRFYHGYSYYSFGNNYMASVIARITMPGLRALVIPDEILKYPYAACSQQSIVMMEVLKDKGLTTRKISFLGKIYGGHFAFEVFYGSTWHFFDPNLEPNAALLGSYGRPAIDFLAHNPEILVKAYSHVSREKVMDIFPTYTYGPVNKFPAPRALIFQKATLFLSYTIWLFFLIAFVLVRRKYLQVCRKSSLQKSMIEGHSMQQEPGPIYYTGYTAQGS